MQKEAVGPTVFKLASTGAAQIGNRLLEGGAVPGILVGWLRPKKGLVTWQI